MKKTLLLFISILISLNVFSQSAEELYKLGNKYENGEMGMGIVDIDYQKALGFYTKSALKDYLPAQKKLAFIYTFGIKREKDLTDLISNKNTIKKNPKKAFFWCKTIAEKGVPYYQLLVGLLYYEGKGVEKNISKAIYWYKKAGENGNSDAQFNLGVFYDNKGNYNEAIYWYKKAANNGKVEAQFNLGILYNKQKNYKEAFYWYNKAVENGFSRAKVNLGNYYLQGLGVERNLTLAFNLFKEAANKDNKVGQYMLALCFESGWGTERNIDKAKYWLNKSSNNGYARATKKLREINNK